MVGIKMKFKFKKHFLLIEFSWKEIFWIIVRKHFKLDRRSTYNFASILVSSVTQMIEKYGDYRTHGPIKIDEIDQQEHKEAKDKQ